MTLSRSAQDAQKGRYSHPPTPARRDAPCHEAAAASEVAGGTYQASLDPLAAITCERIGSLPPQVPRVEPLSHARTPLAGFFSILLDGGLECFLKVIIEPAVFLFCHEVVPHHSDQEPLLLPRLDPRDGSVEFFLLLDSIGIQEHE